MPLWKFRSFAAADAHLARRPTTPEASLETALALLALAEGIRRGVRTTEPGLRGYRSLAEAEAARERYALDRLRQSDLAESG